MPTYMISFLQAAQDDLAWFRPGERNIIYDATMRVLATEAEAESKKRERLRPTPRAVGTEAWQVPGVLRGRGRKQGQDRRHWPQRA